MNEWGEDELIQNDNEVDAWMGRNIDEFAVSRKVMLYEKPAAEHGK